MDFTGKTIDLDENVMLLGDVLSLELWVRVVVFPESSHVFADSHLFFLFSLVVASPVAQDHEERLEELLFSAVKEAEIEKKLREITTEWETQPFARTFVFAEFKKRVGPLSSLPRHPASSRFPLASP